MSSDRTIYDEGAYTKKTNESTKPISYVFDLARQESCMQCDGNVNVAKHVDRVELENDLLGHNRKLSRDPKEKYQKSDNVANTLPFVAPYVCERTLSHPSFRDNGESNRYMEELKKGKK